MDAKEQFSGVEKLPMEGPARVIMGMTGLADGFFLTHSILKE